MGIEEKMKTTSRRIRLDSLCLKPSLEISEKLFKHEDPDNSYTATVLWQIAVRIVTRDHDEFGQRALDFLGKLAYLHHREIDVQILQEMPNFFSNFWTLKSYGLLKDDVVSYHYHRGHGYFTHIGNIYSHSPILMEVIRKGNESVEKELLKDCLEQVKLNLFDDHFCSVWSHAMKYNDLFEQFHQIGDSHFLDALQPKQRDHLLKILIKYKEVYGEDHEMTMRIAVVNDITVEA
jgi:hypothetical protein